MQDSAQKKRETFESDLRWLMGDPRGRRLVFRLLSEIRMFQTTFDPGIKDPEVNMVFREGQKNVGYKILSDINKVCPKSYFEMLQENTLNG